MNKFLFALNLVCEKEKWIGGKLKFHDKEYTILDINIGGFHWIEREFLLKIKYSLTNICLHEEDIYTKISEDCILIKMCSPHHTCVELTKC
jgi:hypothetical protein